MTEALEDRARALRAQAVWIAAGRGQGYIGQALGTADLMACLFFDEGRRFDGDDPDRDRFVLSPGHYALSLYAVLAEQGRLPIELLRTYGMDGSDIEESPLEGLTGFEITGGSLAQGLSQALGIALGKELRGDGGTVFCLISDGELQEGQTWEAVLAAASRAPSNLVVLLDRNGRQVDGPTEDINPLEPVADKLVAFGLATRVLDGHDVAAIQEGLEWAEAQDGPAILVCETELGHGVDAIRDAAYPHYVRADPEFWEDATRRLDSEVSA